MSNVRYPDVEVELSGTEANVYAVIAKVGKAIRRKHGNEAAEEFRNEARQSKSYDDLLQFVMRTVETS